MVRPRAAASPLERAAHSRQASNSSGSSTGQASASCCLSRDLGLLARILSRASGGRRVMAIFAATIVITIGNMIGQVWLNVWRTAATATSQPASTSACGPAHAPIVRMGAHRTALAS